jgi:hypothetical protein
MVRKPNPVTGWSRKTQGSSSIQSIYYMGFDVNKKAFGYCAEDGGGRP